MKSQQFYYERIRAALVEVSTAEKAGGIKLIIKDFQSDLC
jgi:hypothetical protein